MARLPRGSWSLSKTGSSLRYRNFRLLFIGTVFSHTGDFMQAMAQAWLVWTMTNSPFLLGLLGFCQAVPRLLLGAIGGALVDRLDRRRLLLLTQNLAMIQAFVFWALVYFDLIRFWHIVLLVLFIGTVNTLNQTARQSLINTLVPRAELMNAIALNSSIVNLSKVIGPSLGGVLISVIGVAGCLLVNAASFLAIILSLVMMDLPLWQREEKEENFWQEVIEGYNYIKTNHQVFSVLSLAYIVALIGSPYTRFLPVFATDIFHAGPTGFGLLLAAPGVGAVGSGLWLASMGDIRRRRNFVFLSVLAFSLFLMLFSFSRSMLLSLLCLVMVGASHIAFRAVANTTIQMETPPHLLGRILSLFFMDKGLWSFGTFFIGSVASLLGTPRATALSGLICGLSAALLYHRARLRRKLRKGLEEIPLPSKIDLR
ncbi:MAG: MFS transporter [Deltaproteobacteria bacterium]|nr:MFS transporter [Deltaproteobacteria bacterium]